MNIESQYYLPKMAGGYEDCSIYKCSFFNIKFRDTAFWMTRLLIVVVISIIFRVIWILPENQVNITWVFFLYCLSQYFQLE